MPSSVSASLAFIWATPRVVGGWVGVVLELPRVDRGPLTFRLHFASASLVHQGEDADNVS